MTRETDPYQHDGIDGWHHHHGPFNVVTFHEQGAFQTYTDGDADPEREFSMHYAAHDEFQGDDEPCRDARCVWQVKDSTGV